MIYLIGGLPRCGKTTLAKRLGRPWISADTLESIVRVHTKKTDLDRLFPKNVMRRKTKNSNDLMYGAYSATAIAKAYIAQAKASWKAIETVVECEISEGHDYVIEGHQIHPRLVAKLVKKYKKEIVPLFLIRSDADGIVSGCQKNKAKNDWFLQNTRDKKTYYKIAEMIRVYGEYFEKEAGKYGLKVVNMDGDFEGKMRKISENN